MPADLSAIGSADDGQAEGNGERDHHIVGCIAGVVGHLQLVVELRPRFDGGRRDECDEKPLRLDRRGQTSDVLRVRRGIDEKIGGIVAGVAEVALLAAGEALNGGVVFGHWGRTPLDESLRCVAPPDAVHDLALGIQQRQPAAFGVEGLVELGIGHDTDHILLTSPHQEIMAVGRDRGILGPGIDERVLLAGRQPVGQRVALQVKRGGGRVVEFDELQVVVAGPASLHLADDQRGDGQRRLGRRGSGCFLRHAGRQGEQENGQYDGQVLLGHRFSSVRIDTSRKPHHRGTGGAGS